jgi:L-alanine-DL-glutamate epimerase-like enolase superfamily enzyme
MKIAAIREKTFPIASPIPNAVIDFSKMTLSAVAVMTDVVRGGRPVVGYGFNSNGRYGQGALLRERFIPRVLAADPRTLLDETGDNLDPRRIWECAMCNEKPGGHGERSVAVGTLDMAVWDAVAKIAGKPLYRLLAERYGDGRVDETVFVYAAGGPLPPRALLVRGSRRSARLRIAGGAGADRHASRNDRSGVVTGRTALLQPSGSLEPEPGFGVLPVRHVPRSASLLLQSLATSFLVLRRR